MRRARRRGFLWRWWRCVHAETWESAKKAARARVTYSHPPFFFFPLFLPHRRLARWRWCWQLLLQRVALQRDVRRFRRRHRSRDWESKFCRERNRRWRRRPRQLCGWDWARHVHRVRSSVSLRRVPRVVLPRATDVSPHGRVPNADGATRHGLGFRRARGGGRGGRSFFQRRRRWHVWVLDADPRVGHAIDHRRRRRGRVRERGWSRRTEIWRQRVLTAGELPVRRFGRGRDVNWRKWVRPIRSRWRGWRRRGVWRRRRGDGRRHAATPLCGRCQKF